MRLLGILEKLEKRVNNVAVSANCDEKHIADDLHKKEPADWQIIGLLPDY